MDSKPEPSHHSIEPISSAIKAFLAQLSCTDFCAEPKAPYPRVLVALSGGKDSVALLYELSKQLDARKIMAVYIEHNLQDASKDWAFNNQKFCQSLGVSFKSLAIDVDQTTSSLEQAARDARYQALADFIEPNQVLVTGHHLDDQSETFLLRLFRGAGTKGLSAMSDKRGFAGSFLFRPLLSVSRKQIENYITVNNLPFIEDPSNADSQFRRNFLRNEVIPKVASRWPALNKVLAQAAELQSENQDLLEQLAQIDLAHLKAVSNSGLEFELAAFKKLSSARQKNVLRYWLANAGEKMLSLKRLEDLMSQVLSSQSDKNPEFYLEHHCLKRHQNKLYLIPLNELDAVNLPALGQEWWWSAESDLDLGFNKIHLSDFLKKDKNYRGKRFKVTLRKGGEKIYWGDKPHSQSLKKYLQETKTKPWLRSLTLVVWELPSDSNEYRAIFAQPKKT